MRLFVHPAETNGDTGTEVNFRVRVQGEQLSNFFLFCSETSLLSLSLGTINGDCLAISLCAGPWCVLLLPCGATPGLPEGWL